MNQLKKIEKRLSKLQRMQKQLLKKKRKLNQKLAAKKRKKSRASRLVPAKKGVAFSDSFMKKAMLGTALGVVCAIVVTVALKNYKKNRAAEEALTERMGAYAGAVGDSHAEYDKASLEELEDALLRVENELDEVSQAIESAKK